MAEGFLFFGVGEFEDQDYEGDCYGADGEVDVETWVVLVGGMGGKG